MSLSRRHFIGAGLAAGGAAALAPAFAYSGNKMPGWHAGYQTAPAAGFGPSKLALVSGKVPAGLKGSFYRNGPAQFQYGDDYASHWFDGDGMVQRIHIEDGTATHIGRYIDTPKRKAEQTAGKFLAPGFGTVGDPDYPVESPDDVNAANISVMMMDGELLALWEAGSPWRLDPETLESKGPKTWRDDLANMPFLAHPKREPNGRVWNLGVAGPNVAIYKISAGGEVENFGLVNMEIPAYIHDWAMTERHLIILVQPWVMTVSRPPFIDGFEWQPELGLRTLIVDKDDLTSTRWAQGDARAFFHTGAAWEESDGTIRLDAAFYREPVLGSGGGAAEIRGNYDAAHAINGTFSQLVIPPKGDARIIETKLDGDFPQVDPRRHGLARRLTALATGSTPDRPGFTALTVHDWESGKSDTFDFGKNHMVEEHLFIPKPGSTSERESWLIGSVLNAKAGKSQVCVFDAGAVSDGPVCMWQADYAWPLGFHGTWA